MLSMSCCEMFLVFSSSGWTVIDSVLEIFTTMSARSWHLLAMLVTEIVPDVVSRSVNDGYVVCKAKLVNVNTL